MSRKMFHRVITGTSGIEKAVHYQRFANEYKIPVVIYYLCDELFSGERVNGFVFSPDKKPKQIKVKAPAHTFCRMVVGRKSKRKLKRLMKRTNKIFYQLQSGRDRNKWRHITALTENLTTAVHVPETKRLTPDSAVELIKKYGEVIIKPIRGRLSRKVIMIKRDGSNYTIKSKIDQKLNIQTVTAAELKNYIAGMAVRKYIVQQKVKAAKVGDSITEVRISTQKKNSGEWGVTAKSLWISEKNDFLTKFSSGSQCVHFNSKYFKSADVEAAVDRTSKELAKQLAKKISAIDLGFDLMIDDAGKVWFIEANLLDMKRTYMWAGQDEDWYQTVTQPLRYISGKMKG
ncbi:YheC/YheD family protein [Alteribacter natronophilus]|uniref:YheC/YheD family protein n=1 Tax=Alteribacter natronophilus TaxID=2583810 RepID=UPI0014861855|nr:YheC/YheD family protein [Alteribacter natronophilus]